LAQFSKLGRAHKAARRAFSSHWRRHSRAHLAPPPRLRAIIRSN